MERNRIRTQASNRHHRRSRAPDGGAQELYESVRELVDSRAIDIIPRSLYAHKEAIARRRVPRDPNDWAPVALALTFSIGILTKDNDFLGCGCPTWTIETLVAELDGDSFAAD